MGSRKRLTKLLTPVDSLVDPKPPASVADPVTAPNVDSFEPGPIPVPYPPVSVSLVIEEKDPVLAGAVPDPVGD